MEFIHVVNNLHSGQDVKAARVAPFPTRSGGEAKEPMSPLRFGRNEAYEAAAGRPGNDRAVAGSVLRVAVNVVYEFL